MINTDRTRTISGCPQSGEPVTTGKVVSRLGLEPRALALKALPTLSEIKWLRC